MAELAVAMKCRKNVILSKIIPAWSKKTIFSFSKCQFCITLQETLVSETWTVAMGHHFSKRRQSDLDVLPQGRFSFSEEAPPHYSSSRGDLDVVRNAQAGSTSGEVSIGMGAVPGQQSDRRASRQEGRRPSIYSTMDAMPHLEFYSNATATGRLRRSRPSLETLRKAFEVGSLSEQFFYSVFDLMI